MTPEIQNRILAAAARVYAQYGFRGATTRLIANEAGVNEVTLFRTFGSKAELGRRVKGLGPITMARLEPHLRLDPGTIGQKPARRGSLK